MKVIIFWHQSKRNFYYVLNVVIALAFDGNLLFDKYSPLFVVFIALNLCKCNKKKKKTDPNPKGTKGVNYVSSAVFTFRLISEHKSDGQLNINCVDPLNRSALIAAIENENIELIRILLESDIKVNDALLHAISEEYVEAVEMLLYHEETTHKPGEPYVCSSHFEMTSRPLQMKCMSIILLLLSCLSYVHWPDRTGPDCRVGVAIL